MDFVSFVTSYGIGIIAVLAFAVNLIVELTKGIGVLKKVPTDAYVIAVSILLTTLSYFASLGILGNAFVWYEMVLCILAGFVVAYVSMYGWTKLKELYNRFNG